MGAFDDLAKTPNLSLNVPTYEDNCDVEALNENAFILDNEVQAIKDGYLPLKGGTMIGDISYDANNPFVIYTKKLANEIQVGVGTNVIGSVAYIDSNRTNCNIDNLTKRLMACGKFTAVEVV